jgi:SAM-dependent methyltransferase
MNCRLCGRPAFEAGGRVDVRLHRCSACGFVSGVPGVELPSAERYRDYYRGTAPSAPEGRYEEWLEHAERQLGVGRLLEVGAGSGAFVRVARRRGWRVDATEVSETAVAALRSSGAEVFVGELAAARYLDAVFDLVVSLEVIEHVPAPGRDLTEVGRILRPGGLFLVTTPNFNGLSRRYLGDQWRVIAAEHLGYFTPRTLSAALKQAGFSRVAVTSRSLDISTWRSSERSAGKPAAFDPHACAQLRDRVNASFLLNGVKEGLNKVLGLIGAGDTLLAWARR